MNNSFLGGNASFLGNASVLGPAQTPAARYVKGQKVWYVKAAKGKFKEGVVVGVAADHSKYEIALGSQRQKRLLVFENVLLPREVSDKEDLFYLNHPNYPNFAQMLLLKAGEKDFVTFAGRHLVNLKPEVKAKSRYSRSHFVYENLLRNVVSHRFCQHRLSLANDLHFDHLLLLGPNAPQRHADLFKKLSLLFSYKEDNDTQILANLSLLHTEGNTQHDELDDNSFMAANECFFAKPLGHLQVLVDAFLLSGHNADAKATLMSALKARLYFQAEQSDSAKKLYQGFQVQHFSFDGRAAAENEEGLYFNVLYMVCLSDLFGENRPLAAHLKATLQLRLQAFPEIDLALLKKKAKSDLRKVRKALLFFKLSKQTQQSLFDLLAALVLLSGLQVEKGLVAQQREGESDLKIVASLMGLKEESLLADLFREEGEKCLVALRDSLVRQVYSVVVDSLFFFLNCFFQSKFDLDPSSSLPSLNVVSFDSPALQSNALDSLSTLLSTFQDKMVGASLFDIKSLKVYQTELETFLGILNKHTPSYLLDPLSTLAKFTNQLKYAFKSSPLFKVQKDKKNSEFLSLTFEQHRLCLCLDSLLRHNYLHSTPHMRSFIASSLLPLFTAFCDQAQALHKNPEQKISDTVQQCISKESFQHPLSVETALLFLQEDQEKVKKQSYFSYFQGTDKDFQFFLEKNRNQLQFLHYSQQKMLSFCRMLNMLSLRRQSSQVSLYLVCPEEEATQSVLAQLQFYKVQRFYDAKESQMRQPREALLEVAYFRRRPEQVEELFRRGVVGGQEEDMLVFERAFLLESNHSFYLNLDNSYALFDRTVKHLVFAKARKAMLALRFLSRFGKVQRLWGRLEAYLKRARMAKGWHAARKGWFRDNTLLRMGHTLLLKHTHHRHWALRTLRLYKDTLHRLLRLQRWLRARAALKVLFRRVKQAAGQAKVLRILRRRNLVLSFQQLATHRPASPLPEEHSSPGQVVLSPVHSLPASASPVHSLPASASPVYSLPASPVHSVERGKSVATSALLYFERVVQPLLDRQQKTLFTQNKAFQRHHVKVKRRLTQLGAHQNKLKKHWAFSRLKALNDFTARQEQGALTIQRTVRALKESRQEKASRRQLFVKKKQERENKRKEIIYARFLRLAVFQNKIRIFQALHKVKAFAAWVQGREKAARKIQGHFRAEKQREKERIQLEKERTLKKERKLMEEKKMEREKQEKLAQQEQEDKERQAKMQKQQQEIEEQLQKEKDRQLHLEREKERLIQQEKERQAKQEKEKQQLLQQEKDKQRRDIFQTPQRPKSKSPLNEMRRKGKGPPVQKGKSKIPRLEAKLDLQYFQSSWVDRQNRADNPELIQQLKQISSRLSRLQSQAQDIFE